MLCLSCNSLDAINFKLSEGNYMGFFKGTGAIYNVEINIDQDKFVVTNENK